MGPELVTGPDPETAGTALHHAEADVVLKDGSTVHIRRVGDGDEASLVEFFSGLSPRSRYLRFFSMWRDVGEFVQQGIDARPDTRLDLVATRGGAVVGHAMYASRQPGRAEAAFTVDDSLQGHGIGSIMLTHLAAAAHDNGISTFEALVLPENRAMIGVFRDSGFPAAVRSEPGEIHVEFPTSIVPDAVERFEQRQALADAAAVRTLLEPRSIAVIGASRDPISIGGAVFRNLLSFGFRGRLYAVNPNADDVQGQPAWPTVEHIPDDVDLGVVVVPAPSVIDVARACARKGVRSLVVISAGFAESGPEGIARQHELMDVCRGAGVRVVGPNCLGIVNTSPKVSMNATFAPFPPPPGRVGLLTQSGALALSVIDQARSLGIGVSSFVSNGNKADISGNDLLNHWEHDDDTDLIVLYLESFGNPRRFSRIARRVGRTKPILAVKSGRSSPGARATSSHTGALVAASDATVDALFRQAGVIRCDTLSELFDVATLLAHQPVPAGDRVAIISNAGGPGALCADACDSEGVHVPGFTAALQHELATFLPSGAAVANPVDLLAAASPSDYRRTVAAIASSGEVDAVIAIFIPPLVTEPEAVASALREAADDPATALPLLTVFMSSAGAPDSLGRGIPIYLFPEDAARALARAVRHGVWRSRPPGSVPALDDLSPETAAATIASALRRGPGWLAPGEVNEVLAAYGIAEADHRVVAQPNEAAQAAAELGGAIALKAIVPGLLHKTEAGAVRLGLEDPAPVEVAAVEMQRDLGATGFLVQRMAPPGVEMLVGVVHDHHFGPIVAVGAGGTTAELLQDIAVRITPLTDLDVSEMVRSLRTYPLLDGYRGAPKADVRALEDIVLRLSALVEAHREVAELDLNPVVVNPDGAVVVDARVRVEVPEPPRPLGAR